MPPSSTDAAGTLATGTASAAGEVSVKPGVTSCLNRASETTDSMVLSAAALTFGSSSAEAGSSVMDMVTLGASERACEVIRPPLAAPASVLPSVAAMARLIAFEMGSESASVSSDGTAEVA